MSSPKKHKRASLTNLFGDLQIGSSSTNMSSSAITGHVDLPSSIRRTISSTFRAGKGSISVKSLRGIDCSLTIAMDDAYDYKILDDENFDPDDAFPEIISFADELTTILQQNLSRDQEATMHHYLLDCLVRMVFGSNMIEQAGSDREITLKLCRAIFQGQSVPDSIDERDPDYEALKAALVRKNLPANTQAVLRSRREIVQHAKAASFMINELYLKGKDLSEHIILRTHGILTFRVDSDDLKWTDYSGVYRKVQVRAGLHQFPDPRLVPGKMRSMVGEMENDLHRAMKTGEIDPIAFAAKYCHVFVNIHPFADGNGRMCRLILNSLLLKLAGCIVCIGEGSDDRSKYETIAVSSSLAQDYYREEEDEEEPKFYKELATFTLKHAKSSMRNMIRALKGHSWGGEEEDQDGISDG